MRNGSNEPGHFGGKIKPPFHDESDDRAKSGTGRNTEHVRIGQRIAKQSLEADAGDGKRSPDEDGKQNARQADAEDNHAVVTGERTGAMKKEADEVLAEAVQRNLEPRRVSWPRQRQRKE